DEKTVKDGIANAAVKLAKSKSITSESDIQKLGSTISALLTKIQQVAETVLMLSDDNISQILNGKVIPGDRVFYPVKPHIACSIPETQGNYSKITVFALDATDESDVARTEALAQKIESS